MCLQTRAGLVSQIRLCCRQLHDFTHWPHSRRPRGCQAMTSGSVQAVAAPASLPAAGGLECSKGYRRGMPLARRQPWGAGWGRAVPVCVSTPRFIQLRGLWARLGARGEFAPYLGSHSLTCVHIHSVCHSLPWGTLVRGKALLLVPAGQPCQLFLTSEVKKGKQAPFWTDWCGRQLGEHQ